MCNVNINLENEMPEWLKEATVKRTCRCIKEFCECNKSLEPETTPKELSETNAMMNNPHYKERFKAEYYQLKIRMEKLNDFLYKYKNNQLDFTPSCPYNLLLSQRSAMKLYITCLEERAIIEQVGLNTKKQWETPAIREAKADE